MGSRKCPEGCECKRHGTFGSPMARLARNVSELEVAWLAGLLEGEAAFCMQGTGRCRYPTIRLEMTDRDVIERVAEIFGTRVGEKSQRGPGHKPLYYCNVVSARAIAWMERILPYMGTRRSTKIKELLRGDVR